MTTHPGVPDQPRVTVLTRQGCHLCDQVLVVVRQVCADAGVELAEIDIDLPGQESLHVEYTDQVPVTFVDGRRFDFWRIDEVRLRAALG
ncbi:glutaredoxin family protein [Granulicoccus sp. GXG6511]|uniref:glutaredoxin family protein n=1 Tax=Granulicoccus sp. GXG6511 TaxID=3381351 RepID=UPI003D7C46B6